jgi:hypothetical protein
MFRRGKEITQMLDLDPKLYVIPEDIMPELLFLGELETITEAMDDGTILNLTVIKHDGKVFVMKHEYAGRWYDEK